MNADPSYEELLVLYHNARKFVFDYHNERRLDGNVIDAVRAIATACTAILGRGGEDGAR